MISLTLALALVSADPAPVQQGSVHIDEGAVVDAVEDVLAKGKDTVRIALPPLNAADPALRAAVEQALVRAILSRRREEVVTPAYLRAQLRAQAEAQAKDIEVEELKPFAADHVLLSRLEDEGSEKVLRLKLVFSETGEVLGESTAKLGVAGAKSSAQASTVRAATDELVEQIAYGVESKGVDVRTHRIAVSQLRAEGAAAEGRLDRFVQSELIRGLRARGFLVVEREQLAAAVDQAALGQVLEDASAPQVGKLLGAQSIVVGAVSDSGATFLVSLRVVDVESGSVVGGARASLPREDVVSRAAVETRTPMEAAIRSAVAPGWGQAYNGDGVKALAFGIGSYGALATTVGLGVAAGVTSAAYDNVRPIPGELSPEEAGQQARQLFELRSGLLVATAVAGGVTAAVWGGGIVDALLGAPN